MWGTFVSQLWGFVMSAYLVWALMPIPLLYYYWGATAKRLLIVAILVRVICACRCL